MVTALASCCPGIVIAAFTGAVFYLRPTCCVAALCGCIIPSIRSCSSHIRWHDGWAAKIVSALILYFRQKIMDEDCSQAFRFLLAPPTCRSRSQHKSFVI
jgi:hypothetical protein